MTGVTLTYKAVSLRYCDYANHKITGKMNHIEFEAYIVRT
jgi:hypothetical protein